MPQLEQTEFFISQLFWLIVTFSFLLFFLWKISLPRISKVLEKRENKINNDIQEAKDLQTEAEAIQGKIDRELSITHEQVEKLIKETTKNLQNSVSIQLKKTDDELKNKIEESAKNIEKNKNDTLEDIKVQIEEITRLTLSKLTTINISNEEINNTIQKNQNNTLN